CGSPGVKRASLRRIISFATFRPTRPGPTCPADQAKAASRAGIRATSRAGARGNISGWRRRRVGQGRAAAAGPPNAGGPPNTLTVFQRRPFLVGRRSLARAWPTLRYAHPMLLIDE